MLAPADLDRNEVKTPTLRNPRRVGHPWGRAEYVVRAAPVTSRVMINIKGVGKDGRAVFAPV